MNAQVHAQTASQPVLAEGLERYIDLMRGSPGGAARSVSAQRLRSDASAADLRCEPLCDIKTFTTFIVRDGQEIAVRVYQPRSQSNLPGICYFHGGGFLFGSIESFDAVAAGLAEYTGAVVTSVQYRRLPENSYRAAQEDCYAALLWLEEHAEDLGVDPYNVAVAGDSVGALLATIASAMSRDRGGPQLACQILLYGAYAMQPERRCYGSSRDPLLTPARIESFIRAYHRQHASTFYPPPLDLDNLSELPPAVIVLAEHDPLCEEGLEYAGRLRTAGVHVDVSLAPGMIHGFLRARKMCPAADRELADLAHKARQHLAKPR